MADAPWPSSVRMLYLPTLRGLSDMSRSLAQLPLDDAKQVAREREETGAGNVGGGDRRRGDGTAVVAVHRTAIRRIVVVLEQVFHQRPPFRLAHEPLPVLD